MVNVHYLYKPSPLGLYVRLGHTGHRRLADLYASGKFPIDRVIVDASHLAQQGDLLKTLRADNAEIILDPNAAEMASVGRCGGAVRRLPWAKPNGQHWCPSDFDSSHIKDVAKRIAAFCVEQRVSAVLSPNHLLSGGKDAWSTIDVRQCETLRVALDAAGGGAIEIDYPLLLPYGVFRDTSHRRAILGTLKDLPIGNLWVRVSRYGDLATAAAVREYAGACLDLHDLGKPIIADHVGGLAGLALLALGSAGAIAHGIASKERFDTSKWHLPPSKGRGGSILRAYFPGLDAHLSLDDAKKALGARGGKSLLGCRDTRCCPRGAEDTLAHPDSHFLRQRFDQLMDLERVPDLRRPEHFLSAHVSLAEQVARKAARLRVADDKLTKKLKTSARRLERLRGTLEHLAIAGSNVTRSQSPSHRGVHNEDSKSNRGSTDG